MRKLFFILISAVLILSLRAGAASAFLLGDEINLGHAIPHSNEVIDGFYVTVESGLADQRQFGGVYYANPEDHTVNYDFIRNFTFSSDSFNGNVIDFIDTPLTTVWVETNMNGWDNSRYAFNSSRAEFNWSGLSVDQDTYFIAHLNEDEFPIGTVPEPSSLALLSLGIMGAGFFLKKKEKM
jgi:hypothetical protein